MLRSMYFDKVHHFSICKMLNYMWVGFLVQRITSFLRLSEQNISYANFYNSQNYPIPIPGCANRPHCDIQSRDTYLDIGTQIEISLRYPNQAL